MLIFGGTVFLGRHLVDAALSQGHEVVLFNRGRTDPELFPQVKKLRGDRDGDLDALGGRSFNVVIDTSGYIPRVVRDSARLLADASEHYVFVSSISVYEDFTDANIDESAATAELEDDVSEDVELYYGPLKLACEREVSNAFGDRALIVRPGLIVGPFDPTDRFTYWVTRIAAGGEVLAPDPPDGSGSGD
jgi:2'-hydroxyisoflavone reductase